MALAHSPKIATDGLVFAYDMSNTQKSWKGAPTTNLLAQPLSFQTGYTSESWSTGEVIDNNQIAPDGTQSATKITRVSGYFYKRNVASPTFTISPGQTITFSCWVKKLDATNQTGRGIYIWCYNGAGSANRTVATQEIFNNTWVRQSATYTALTDETDFSFGFSGAAANHLQGSIAIWKPQVEISSYATPFVNGTRSNTQAIIDLMGTNTITATSLTYTSNNTFSFNGSGNYILPATSAMPSGSSFSLNVWIKINVVSASSIVEFRNSSGGRTLNVHLPWSDNNVYFDSGGPSGSLSYDRLVYASSVSDRAGWHNWCFIKDISTGTMYIYLDGVLKQSATGMNIIPSATTDAGIGSYVNGISNFFNGDIPAMSIYNRALSAAEVQQNFNALRTRYGV